MTAATARRPSLHLVTESAVPSGMGAHMMILARGLTAQYDVVVAAPRGTSLLGEARDAGLAVKEIDPADPQDLSRWFARTRPDIAHIHAGIGWEGHSSVSAAHAAAARVIRTEHLPYLLTDDTQRTAYRDALDRVDRLVAVSASVARSHAAAGLGHALDDRMVTVSNGATPRPPSRTRAALRREWALDDGPVLLMAGRFAPQKGHDAMLAAMPAILAAYPRATLLMAGAGTLLLDTARAIAGGALAGAVRLLGQRADLPDLMHAADLLVLPSRFEGLSLVALEAMAAGLPIVATDIAANAEMLDDGRAGWLAGTDPAAFAATVNAALSDPARGATLAAAAMERHATLYSADRMVTATAAIYATEAATPPRRTGDRMTRIGFIGAGGIAHRHFGVLDQFADVRIAAVADVDLDRATAAAARFGVHAYADAASMLANTELDAVFICVPPFAHGAPERAALAAGLPFLVEKPVALDLDTAEAIAGEVAAAALITAVGYHWRYLDTVDEVRRLLADTPARLLSGYWLDSTPPPQWWWHVGSSGGQMVEQTTHLLDLARYLCGEVTTVFGLANHTDRAEFPGLDVPTVSTASLRFASGAAANFASTCLLGWNHRVALHVFGERLAIELTDHDLMVDVGRGRPVRRAEGDPVWRMDRDFIDAVRGGPNLIRCSYADAVATHRVAVAVGQSTQTGRAIDLAAAS